MVATRGGGQRACVGVRLLRARGVGRTLVRISWQVIATVVEAHSRMLTIVASAIAARVARVPASGDDEHRAAHAATVPRTQAALPLAAWSRARQLSPHADGRIV